MPRKKKTLPPGLERQPCAPDVTGFRLEPEFRLLLGERASQLGISPHQLAKIYVTERLLEPQEREALRQAIKMTNEDLSSFREDFAYALQAVLSSAGTLSKEKAKAWVEEHLSLE